MRRRSGIHVELELEIASRRAVSGRVRRVDLAVEPLTAGFRDGRPADPGIRIAEDLHGVIARPEATQLVVDHESRYLAAVDHDLSWHERAEIARPLDQEAELVRIGSEGPGDHAGSEDVLREEHADTRECLVRRQHRGLVWRDQLLETAAVSVHELHHL